MANRIFTKWDFSRILRSLFGIIAIAYGIYSSEYLFFVIGGLFIFQAILNLSCCGAQGCNSRNDENKYVYKDQIKEYKPK